ncbi:MAG: hypothetical protein FD129_2236, partial [bacterium]
MIRRARPVAICRRGLLVVAWLAALLIGVSAARPSSAAETGVEASVDRTNVPIDGQVIYSITVSGGMRQLPNPELPLLDADWTVYSGGT